MNPHLMTDPRLTQVLNELKQREPIFHRPEFGTTRQDFEQMTDPAFWEVGASGRRYSRAYVLDTLEKRAQNPAEETWETQDFHCLELGGNTYSGLQLHEGQ
jgi:hypothetical protein